MAVQHSFHEKETKVGRKTRRHGLGSARYFSVAGTFTNWLGVSCPKSVVGLGSLGLILDFWVETSLVRDLGNLRLRAFLTAPF